MTPAKWWRINKYAPRINKCILKERRDEDGEMCFLLVCLFLSHLTVFTVPLPQYAYIVPRPPSFPLSLNPKVETTDELWLTPKGYHHTIMIQNNYCITYTELLTILSETEEKTF